jgi:enoyl-CoA hydratase/carnithine racemase
LSVLLTPSEALDLVGEGLDVAAVGPAGAMPVIGLALFPEASDEGAVARLLDVLRRAPVVLVGAARGSAPSRPVLAGLDVLLCEEPDPPAPWIACPDGVESELERLTDAARRSPQASTALAQLLRLGEPMAAAEAVVAESWVYGLLQAGAVHRSWLAERAGRSRRPRPDGPVVAVARRDDVLTIVLDRPEVRNAYGARMRDELVAALDVARLDPSVARVELRGAGPSFCSGGDLDEFGTALDPADAHVVRTTRNAGMALAGMAGRTTAFVHGACVGAGVELPAFAGEVVAHPAATFRLPEIAMGLVPGAGGTASIPRRVGRHRCAHLALAGDPIDAVTALRWGLVDRVDATAFPDLGDPS